MRRCTVKDELACLARQGDDFRRIVAPTKDDPLHGLVTFLDVFDVRTSYPLLPTMLDAGLDDGQWCSVATMLESYLLRRAVCGLTTKNYNRVFLGIHALTATGRASRRITSPSSSPNNPAIPPNGPATTDLPKPGAPNMLAISRFLEELSMS
ncbi:MAG: hypothetical protein U1E57_09475 [Paenacidovorax caeni]